MLKILSNQINHLGLINKREEVKIKRSDSSIGKMALMIFGGLAAGMLVSQLFKANQEPSPGAMDAFMAKVVTLDPLDDSFIKYLDNLSITEANRLLEENQCCNAINTGASSILDNKSYNLFLDHAAKKCSASFDKIKELRQKDNSTNARYFLRCPEQEGLTKHAYCEDKNLVNEAKKISDANELQKALHFLSSVCPTKEVLEQVEGSIKDDNKHISISIDLIKMYINQGNWQDAVNFIEKIRTPEQQDGVRGFLAHKSSDAAFQEKMISQIKDESILKNVLNKIILKQENWSQLVNLIKYIPQSSGRDELRHYIVFKCPDDQIRNQMINEMENPKNPNA